MAPHPTKLELRGSDKLAIAWSDEQVREYTFRELRDRCPCATCREKRNAPEKPAPLLTVLGPGQLQPLKVVDVSPVGNYAYSIAFSDGHDTGIYTLEFLREFGTVSSGVK